MLDYSQKPELEICREKPLKTILIVDDEATVRDLCIRALKGYHLLQAGSGEAALAFFDKGGIDVILTDVMMPGMDGIELLKRIKEKDPTVVVIVMTGLAEKDVILNALKEDADDFISKPLNLLQLKTAIDKALVKKALKDEIATLKSIDRLKSNFLSIISHKFRTPITAISLFLQNLATGVFAGDDPEFRMNVRLISDESAYLERLVSDLLAFSRMMDNGAALRRESFSLAKVIHRIMGESGEIALKPAIEAVLDLHRAPEIIADQDKIAFTLKQIIDNAYKFSGEEGEVSISLREEGENMLIAVADTGCGIPPEEIPKIFEKFYQIDPYNTGQVRGFGLGLYYAREFILMHGGSISVESTVGRGTKVVVALPLQDQQSAK
jgi:two-component system sensor histidine kinase/response regulator